VLAQAMFADFDAVESHMTYNGIDTVITSPDGSDTITLLGVDASSLHASDFRFG